MISLDIEQIKNRDVYLRKSFDLYLDEEYKFDILVSLIWQIEIYLKEKIPKFWYINFAFFYHLIKNR